MPSTLQRPVHISKVHRIRKLFSSWFEKMTEQESLGLFDLFELTSGPDIQTDWF